MIELSRYLPKYPTFLNGLTYYGSHIGFKNDFKVNVIDDIDLVLIMSVNPGFGGQSFIHSSLEKISQVRKMIDDSGKDIRLEVDGGINKDTIGLASKAGADTFVAGSAIFNTENYEQTISELRSKIN